MIIKAVCSESSREEKIVHKPNCLRLSNDGDPTKTDGNRSLDEILQINVLRYFSMHLSMGLSVSKIEIYLMGIILLSTTPTYVLYD